MSAAKKTTLFLVAASILTGILLGVIGLRYFTVPQSAARTFGVASRPAGHELYYIIGLRSLWLAALAIGLAALRQWHGLALWFAGGTAVCVADALIVANATGKLPQVAFHLGVGLAFALLAALARRRAGKGP